MAIDHCIRFFVGHILETKQQDGIRPAHVNALWIAFRYQTDTTRLIPYLLGLAKCLANNIFARFWDKNIKALVWVLGMVGGGGGVVGVVWLHWYPHHPYHHHKHHRQ